MVTPVFVISGLLDSGKTTLIKNMFRSPDFRNNGPTLLIMCEDGEEEFERVWIRFLKQIFLKIGRLQAYILWLTVKQQKYICLI